MADDTAIISETQNWLRDVVIAHNLCPFARREFDGGHIHYEVIRTEDRQAQMEAVLSECAALNEDGERETSLLIFPEALSDFDDYLDVLALANAVLKESGYEGIYQLASFHPHYIFEGAAEDDAANYTNRSPYPMLHILREASVEAALASYPNPEGIPKRNVEVTRELGVQVMRDLLRQC